MTSGGIDWQREKWKSGFGSKFIRQGEKNAVKYADEIIVLSKGVQDYFRDTYGRETHFIPNGVNRPETREGGVHMGQITVTKAPIDGLYVIEPTVHGDSRGYFVETYNQHDMHEAGLDMVFVQDNQSMSRKHSKIYQMQEGKNLFMDLNACGKEALLHRIFKS